MGKLTISMAIFNSYFDITRGYDVRETVPYFDPMIFDPRPGQSFGDFLGATFRRYYASWHDLAEGTLGGMGGNEGKR